MPPGVPEVMRIGQARLTAGLDRHVRVDRGSYRIVFGDMPRYQAAQLIALAQQADLRGRGGAAFPVARKLSAVLRGSRARKRAPVVVVNGTEGEPGSEKDRMLLLRSPYLVLHGALAAARALRAHSLVVGVADPLVARSVRQAVASEPALRRMTRVVQVPDRFVAGESGALINAINGRAPLPPGRKVRASESGVDRRPTLLSNAETFAQLAVLAMLGPEGYASAGTSAEPGTVLLTVGGAAGRPAVVEVPAGHRLGEVLDLCEVPPAQGILVGGYHGSWLPAEVAYDVPVSRAGLMAAGGTLGAGIVLALGADCCPLGEVAKVAAYLARESSGQCGPCKLGLPGIARAFAALAEGSAGADALDAARRSVASVRGRGACAHPDGVSRFMMSAIDVFSDDLATHLFRGSCGRPVTGALPLPSPDGEKQLTIDWTRCRGHGLCAHIVPELVQLDEQGYPLPLDMAVPRWLERGARQAVEMCPALALRITPAPGTAPARRPRAARERASRQPAVSGKPGPSRRPAVTGQPAVSGRPAVADRQPAVSGPPAVASRESPRVLTGKVVDFAVSEEWIAELSADRRS